MKQIYVANSEVHSEQLEEIFDLKEKINILEKENVALKSKSK